jgi:hypothetical protein
MPLSFSKEGGIYAFDIPSPGVYYIVQNDGTYTKQYLEYKKLFVLHLVSIYSEEEFDANRAKIVKSSSIFELCSIESVNIPCYQTSPFNHTNPPVNMQHVTHIELHMNHVQDREYPEIHFEFVSGKKAVWRYPDDTTTVETDREEYTRTKRSTKQIPDTAKRDADYKRLLGINTA